MNRYRQNLKPFALIYKGGIFIAYLIQRGIKYGGSVPNFDITESPPTNPNIKLWFDNSNDSVAEAKDIAYNNFSGIINTITVQSTLDAFGNEIASGWIPLLGVFTYSNATTITTNVNLTSTLSAGMKIKLTNSTVKYSTIKSVSATTIDLAESILTSGTITNVFFSMSYMPFGVAPDKFLATNFTVEYGILNGWEYEKYNSGKITLKTELIYTPDQKLTQVTGSNIYATPLEIALPFTLSDANYDAKIYGVYCYLMGTKITDSTASILRYSLYSVFPYTAGLNGTKCIVEVTGQWK